MVLIFIFNFCYGLTSLNRNKHILKNIVSVEQLNSDVENLNTNDEVDPVIGDSNENNQEGNYLENAIEDIDFCKKILNDNLKIIVDELENIIIATIKHKEKMLEKVELALNLENSKFKRKEELAKNNMTTKIKSIYRNRISDLKNCILLFNKEIKDCNKYVDEFISEVSFIDEIQFEKIRNDLCILIDENQDYFNSYFSTKKKEFEELKTKIENCLINF